MNYRSNDLDNLIAVIAQRDRMARYLDDSAAPERRRPAQGRRAPLRRRA